MEVRTPSYEALLRACAEEIEADVSQVAKIRKLPNVLVRRDRDVQRLKEGQELEIVLKDGSNTSTHLNIASFNTSGLSLLNLPTLSGDTPPLPPTAAGSAGLALHPASQQLNGLH